MRCSVIITTRNRPDNLQRCVESVLQQQPLGIVHEIIIVDDASTVSEKEKYQAMGSTQLPVYYLSNNVNSGPSASRNAGANHASGDLFLFLDDDIEVDDAYVFSHSLRHGENNIITFGNLEFPADMWRKNNLMRYLNFRYVGNRHLSDEALKNLPADNFACGISAIKRADFFKVGGFPVMFRYYGCEDVYFGQLLRKMGTRIAFVEGARALHYDQVTIERYRAKALETAREGWPILFNQFPELLENSNIQWLRPLQTNDPLIMRFIKPIMPLFFNRFSQWCLEALARSTNDKPWLYSFLLQRTLFTCWYYRGGRSKSKTKP